MADEDEGTPAGPLLDEAGVRFDLRRDQRITDIVVLAKTTSLEDGSVGLIVADSGVDWIVKRGMLAAADEVVAMNGLTTLGEDDD